MTMPTEENILITFEETIPLSELTGREKQIYYRGKWDGSAKGIWEHKILLIIYTLVIFIIGCGVQLYTHLFIK